MTITKLEISKTAPHKRSYGAGLYPLHPTPSDRVTITAEDRAYYAEHPIVLTDLAPGRVEAVPEFGPWGSDRHRHPELARAQFGALNIADETAAAGQTAMPCVDGHQHEWLLDPYSDRRKPTPFWERTGYTDGQHYVCRHCKLPVTVGTARIARKPAIACPYEARNKREERLEKQGAAPAPTALLQAA